MADKVLQETPEMTLDEICQSCGLSTETVLTYVQEGLIDVHGDPASGWRFSEIQMIHIQKAGRLERDLRLNPAGSVLALELMEKIKNLENQIKRLESYHKESLE